MDVIRALASTLPSATLRVALSQMPGPFLLIHSCSSFILLGNIKEKIKEKKKTFHKKINLEILRYFISQIVFTRPLESFAFLPAVRERNIH